MSHPKHLFERKIKSTCLYKGGAISFYKDRVRLPNGREAVRDYMRHPGAVCVVPFISPRKVLILRQYRYPVSQTIFEFPAGKLDGKETPFFCAKRELVEETGYKAKRWKKLGEFWPTPAFATEVMYNYIAWDLKFTGAKLDEDESLEVFPIEFSTVLEWVRVGKIKDSKSVIAALTVQAFNLFPFQK